MGFAVPMLLTVLLMFKSRRNYTMLKTFYYKCGDDMYTVFGQAMNGFSYV